MIDSSEFVIKSKKTQPYSYSYTDTYTDTRIFTYTLHLHRHVHLHHFPCFSLHVTSFSVFSVVSHARFHVPTLVSISVAFHVYFFSCVLFKFFVAQPSGGQCVFSNTFAFHNRRGRTRCGLGAHVPPCPSSHIMMFLRVLYT